MCGGAGGGGDLALAGARAVGCAAAPNGAGLRAAPVLAALLVKAPLWGASLGRLFWSSFGEIDF